MEILKTDYLIVGSGAMGMAFADTLLSETDSDIIIVDKYAKPGGHWNHAYPFVTLHQPSQFYGVSSKELSKGRIDQIGLNKGLYDLASGAEVSAYYEEVMNHTFLPSGRVRYFPLAEYIGDRSFSSLINGDSYQVEIKKKLVDATYLKTTVPSLHTPNFRVDSNVNFIPLNDLPSIASPPEGFVIIGGGKTGVDACLWLLEKGIHPDKISWIISRDAWMLDRRNSQPTLEFFEYSLGAIANQFEAIAASTSVDDMWHKLETTGVLVRLDKEHRPTMFHGATVSQQELVELRKIKNVIRLGRVQHILGDSIILDKGVIPTSPNQIHVDCSASAITNLDTKPIFQNELITPQTVRAYQPVFSASVIAYIEAHYSSDKEKNNLCQVVPLPNHDTDWISMTAVQMVNQITWAQDKELRKWIKGNRLDGFSDMISQIEKSDKEKLQILFRIKKNGLPAMMKLKNYMAEIASNHTQKA